jgi:tetratricopeptide (TPR) repeat protein
MSIYSFSQLPPPQLLVQLLQKNFSGSFNLVDSKRSLIIYFSDGSPVDFSSENIPNLDENLEEAVLYIFNDDVLNFKLENSEKKSGTPLNPFYLLAKGIKTKYSKERLLREASKLISVPVVFVKGHKKFIEMFQFDSFEMSMVAKLDSKKYSARDLAKELDQKIGRILSFYYTLACSHLIQAAKAQIKIDENLFDESKLLLKELMGNLDDIEKKNMFERMGIPNTANTMDVNDAFKEKAKKFHPDNMSRNGLDKYKHHAEKYFKLLTEAYDVLKDPDQRKALNAKPLSEVEKHKIQMALGAEVDYQKAMIHFRKQEYVQAEASLKAAIKKTPDDGVYIGLWAWVCYLNPEHDKESIRENIKIALLQAVKLTPNEARINYYLGKVLIDLGLYASAQKYLNKAIEIKPDYLEASRELKMLGRRRPTNRFLKTTGKFLNIFKK